MYHIYISIWRLTASFIKSPWMLETLTKISNKYVKIWSPLCKYVAIHKQDTYALYSEFYQSWINDIKQLALWDYLQLDWTSNTSRQKINLPTNQRGYDNSETTVGKLSARRIQIYCVYFSLIILTSYLFKQVKAWPQQKYTQQIWIRLVE